MTNSFKNTTFTRNFANLFININQHAYRHNIQTHTHTLTKSIRFPMDLSSHARHYTRCLHSCSSNSAGCVHNIRNLSARFPWCSLASDSGLMHMQRSKGYAMALRDPYSRPPWVAMSEGLYIRREEATTARNFSQILLASQINARCSIVLAPIPLLSLL